jgi:hypothetical protein
LVKLRATPIPMHSSIRRSRNIFIGLGNPSVS